MSISVKICGIASEQALEAAIQGGADYAGFVFFPKSPRHISLSRAAELAEHARGRIQIVSLSVDAPDSLLIDIARIVRPDFLQLHGKESVDRIAAIQAMTDIPIMKAVRVGSPADIASAAVYERVCHRILFDAHVPEGDAHVLPGGNGVAFDWAWLANAGVRPNFMLSGGLNSANVQTALRISAAAAVDVSSGVESVPGVKDPSLITAFINAARSFERAAPDGKAAQ